MNITHYMITESSTPPLASDTGWIAVAPTQNLTITGGTYIMSTAAGTKNIYAWVKMESGSVNSLSASSHFDVLLTATDITAPKVVSLLKNPR